MMKTFFIGLIILANACNQTDAEQVRKPNTTWQTTDQPPVYPGCEDIESIAAQWDCFQGSISRAIGAFFTDNPLRINPTAPNTLVLYISVDHSGKVRLKGMEPESSNAIREAMKMAIERLPKMSPATKTNLGITAQVQFRIPIQLQN